MALTYLRREVVPLLDGRCDDPTGRVLLNAIAELKLDLGWMAYDAGDQLLARAYMSQALRLAHAAGERLFGGRVLCAMSHQALHIGQVQSAIDLVRAARAGTERLAPPRAVAMLAAMEAVAQAAKHDEPACVAALRDAEAALGHAIEDELDWLEFDEGGLMGHIARAYRYLRQGKQCERYAEQSVVSCQSDHGRTRAQRLAILSAAHLQQGDLEQAAAIGERMVREAWYLRSRHVDEEVAGLTQAVKRRCPPGGRDFLAAAREYLAARAV